MSRFAELFETPCPIIGMLHAPPLPGSPGYQGDVAAIRRHVLDDAQALVDGGVQGLMLENYGDVPFFPDRVPAVTVAMLTALASEVRSQFPPVPLGINVLRNDGCAALAVAVATGAQFIRVNVLCGARLADQGLLQGIAHQLLRDRAQLSAEHVAILADVDVKHSAPLATRPLEEETRDLIHRGLADALIVSGQATGAAADPQQLHAVQHAAPGVPVLVGSGIDASNVARFAAAGGWIVGTAFKPPGRPQAAVNRHRVEQFCAAVQAALK